MILVELLAELHAHGIRLDDLKIDTNDMERTVDIPIRVMTNRRGEDTIISEMIRAVYVYKDVLTRLQARSLDGSWAIPEDIGMDKVEQAKVVPLFLRAIKSMKNRMPYGHVVYWAKRPAPRNTFYIELLHCTDDCMMKRDYKSMELTRQFETCAGMRYRIGSLAAWRDRPEYWRDILPSISFDG